MSRRETLQNALFLLYEKNSIKKVAFIEATSMSLTNPSLEENDDEEDKNQGKDFSPKYHKDKPLSLNGHID